MGFDCISPLVFLRNIILQVVFKVLCLVFVQKSCFWEAANVQIQVFLGGQEISEVLISGRDTNKIDKLFPQINSLLPRINILCVQISILLSLIHFTHFCANKMLVKC